MTKLPENRATEPFTGGIWQGGDPGER